jgi:YjbE family integral membrane protein
MPELLTPGAVAAFFQVILIDLALAGDNAVAVGVAAAGLPPPQRRRAIVLGMAGAAAMLIVFALITSQLLKIVGLTVAGGFLLLWVCWKMWRELRAHGREESAEGEAALQEATGVEIGGKPRAVAKPKTLGQALIQILLTDIVMSLDNVLAVSGAAHGHMWVLVAGLAISITLTGFAASLVARLLHRFRWIGYVGLAIVLYVAVHMIWEGSRTAAIDLHKTGAYNEAMPGKAADIKPTEEQERKGR